MLIQKDPSMGNNTFYLGRRKDSQLKGGALSTVIGNTFYGKIEEFERKNSRDETPPPYVMYKLP